MRWWVYSRSGRGGEVGGGYVRMVEVVSWWGYVRMVGGGEMVSVRIEKGTVVD